MPQVFGWALVTLGSLALIEVMRRERQRVEARVAAAAARRDPRQPIPLEQDPATGRYRPRSY